MQDGMHHGKFLFIVSLVSRSHEGVCATCIPCKGQCGVVC